MAAKKQQRVPRGAEEKVDVTDLDAGQRDWPLVRAKTTQVGSSNRVRRAWQ